MASGFPLGISFDDLLCATKETGRHLPVSTVYSIAKQCVTKWLSEMFQLKWKAFKILFFSAFRARSSAHRIKKLCRSSYSTKTVSISLLETSGFILQVHLFISHKAEIRKKIFNKRLSILNTFLIEKTHMSPWSSGEGCCHEHRCRE